MAKTKIEKIAGIEEQIAQLENQRKKLLQLQKKEERNARVKRLIERGAILESLIDGAAALNNEQIKAFLEKTILSEYSRRVLATVTAQNDGTTAPKATETVLSSNTIPAAGTSFPGEVGDEAVNGGEGNAARATG
jgi:flagellar motility protein MotE (MotC chaperone)